VVGVTIYRCFCVTDEGRIITGAKIAAKDLLAALLAANDLWRTVPDFHLVEVWLGRRRLYPPAMPPEAAPGRQKPPGRPSSAGARRRRPRAS
jgi:hypothetical protein